MKILVLALVFSFLLSGKSFCQWSTIPDTAIFLGYGEPADLIKDGKDGAYLGYHYGDFVVNHVDKFGYLQWNPPKNAVRQSVYPNAQIIGSLDYDDNGSFFAVVTEAFPINQWYFEGRVWVNKLDSTGTKLWGNNGIRVSLTNNDQGNPEIISDKNGGCYVAYLQRNGAVPSGTVSIYAQHFDSLGNRLFGNSGLELFLLGNNLSTSGPLIGKLIRTSDGCIIVSPSACFRINANGLVWTVLPNSFYFGFGMTGATSDGNDGAVCFAFDSILEPRCLRIDSSGNYPWNGGSVVLGSIPWTSGAGIGQWMDIQRTFDNNFINYWAFISSDSLGNVFTLPSSIREINYAGNLISNIFFPNAGQNNTTPEGIINSVNDSNIFFWADSGYGGGCQRIDNNNLKLWGNNGVQITNKGFGFGINKITSDNRGGAIILWRDGNAMLWLQHISRHGNLGEILNDYGDVNENGVLDSLDAVLVLNSVTGLDTLTQNQFEVADVDGNGKVNVEDASLIIKKIKNLINNFPIHLLEE